MKSSNELRELLHRIDHKGYPAYKDTRGSYGFMGYTLCIDHVQGDPFASPSKVSIHIKGKDAGFPRDLWQMKCRRIALCDYLLRRFGANVAKLSFQAKGSGKSGLMSVSRPGQEVLERTACRMDPESGDIVLRMEIGFPANGRTVNARELEKILFDLLPGCAMKTLYYRSLDAAEVKNVTDLAEDRQYISDHLKERGLVAFVADGSILPRESGVSGKPMKDAVPFESPQSLAVEFVLPHRGKITGMGIRRGITLIVGGGYHGKSTLLEALERGVYPHIAGDGREYVVTEDTASKIRAEDGRSIRNVDISLFIRDLPNGKDTKSFYTEDASGSTSQAANMSEAIEAGTHTFLIDEDTSATNFMIRDELMQRVVHRDAEPIVPFIDRVRDIYEKAGISTILVAGSSGSYFNVSDCVIQMNKYKPYEITELAKKEAAAYGGLANAPAADRSSKSRLASEGACVRENAASENPGFMIPSYRRIIRPDKTFAGDRVKLRSMGLDTISINHENIDVRYMEQLVDTEQLAALGYMLKYAQCHIFNGRKTLGEAVDELLGVVEASGLSAITESSHVPCGLAMVRRQEIFACIDRYRKLGV
jgi:predicted ABC-class ATPase